MGSSHQEGTGHGGPASGEYESPGVRNPDDFPVDLQNTPKFLSVSPQEI